MAHHGLISAYLRELHASVPRLPDADDIVAEAADHLEEAADQLRSHGRSEFEAEAEAVARFGSAELVARICMIESKRGAAVPTTRTRWAGLVLFFAPILLVGGTWGNYATDKGSLHGFVVFLSGLSLPALLVGLWGLRVRHGGLDRIGLIAFAVALIAAPFSMFFSYYRLVIFPALLGLALLIFAVEMLRARILPVVPLVLMAAGPLLTLVVAIVFSIVHGDEEVVMGFAAAAIPILISLVWLGWFMWREPPVDRRPRRAHTIA